MTFKERIMLGQQVADRRRELRISREEAGLRSGVSAATIRAVEHGTEVRRSTLMGVAIGLALPNLAAR